jgi:hypothetical protein
MLTTKFPFLFPRSLESDLAERLRSLADDVERMRSGEGPSAAQLDSAPVIREWELRRASAVRLVGRVSGHPVLGSTTAMTSQIWAVDERGTWVRSLNRFYRLGTPATPDEDHDDETLTDV